MSGGGGGGRANCISIPLVTRVRRDGHLLTHGPHPS